MPSFELYYLHRHWVLTIKRNGVLPEYYTSEHVDKILEYLQKEMTAPIVPWD